MIVSIKQECIPVGCVPSAAVAVSRGGCLPGGCTWSWGDVPGLGGCTWSGGVYLVQGVYLVRGVAPGQVLPHCGQTHACKNITFATSLRTVIRSVNLYVLQVRPVDQDYQESQEHLPVYETFS